MKMGLIQPFINAADAVLSQGLNSPIEIGNLTMEEDAYRRKGVAAMVELSGDIEGRIILDIEPSAAARIASMLSGSDVPETDNLVREAVCELANQVIGNAVATLNDEGFHFRVHPPHLHTSEQGARNTTDIEAMVLSFDSKSGSIFMNIALRYSATAAAV
ncbi:MAG TPA: chemotaxis protein CheX [Terriglobales bacterium]|nr:chemotaxis protein CheX [Terriglobales bacterium]